MGIIFQPTCKCQVYTPMSLGGGMLGSDFIYLPYYCDECKIIKKGNVLKGKCNCSVCKNEMTLYGRIVGYFSDDESDRYYNPKKVLFDWTIEMDLEYILEDKKYHCPICKEKELEFIEMGTWD